MEGNEKQQHLSGVSAEECVGDRVRICSPSRGFPAKRAKQHVCPLEDFWRRELGLLGTTAFARRAGGRQDFVQRLHLHKKLDGHDGCVNTVSFTPDGCWLLSGSDDRHIVLWDWSAGIQKLCYYSGHINNVFQARAMPFSNNKVIVSCAADGQVRVGTLAEGGKNVETKRLAKHRGRAHKLAVEPGSPHTFFSCGEDGIVRKFDLRDTKLPSKLCTVRSPHKARLLEAVGINAIVVNPRRPHLFAVGGSDVFARVYDVRRVSSGESDRDQCVDTFAPPHLLKTREVHITCVAYSEQEELLITYNDELIYLFDKDQGMGPSPARPASRNGKEPLEKEESPTNQAAQVYRGHRNAQTVKGVNFFGPSSEYVVSGSDCGHIFIWRKKGGQLVTLLPGDTSVVNCLEPHPYATVLATSGIESNVKVWTPTAERILPLPEGAEKIMETNRRRREERRPRRMTQDLSPELLIRIMRLQQRRVDSDLAEGEVTYVTRAGYEEDIGDEDIDDDDSGGDNSSEDDTPSSDGEGPARGRRRQRSHQPPECRVA